MSDEKEQPKSNPNPSADQVQMPKINFTTFVLSLNSSALVNLGFETDPLSGRKSTSLPIAKQTIDILAMLEEKTRGNLSDDEKRLMTHILYELRLLYVKKRDEK
jgi:hypothetical protein